ncbi:WD repeat-containing protein 47 [Amphibalanus amphitrite]|uniref:WD repeat-containing protein 47 n=1 Tax=Amphibalanus amphitrite TaxID=1232801 RepID=A0A6A4W3Y6_AMPAM|nr:WD repeat-containing protein 47 [Amphibalanus amphitrite]
MPSAHLYFPDRCCLLQYHLYLADVSSLRFRLCIQYIMPSAHLYLREEEVVKLMLEFLHNRQLHISQLSVEREAGIINASLSDDLLFLRQLILDGQWDDAIEFVQPLTSVESFDTKRFHYEVLKVKYVELLCIKSEAGAQDNMEQAVEEVVKVLNELEKYCESKEEYAALCLLLTLPRLGDHSEYRDWNPSAARVACFRAVLPLVEKFLPSERKRGGERQNECASNDRLIQLLIKGILYESCVEYCQQKATSGGTEASGEMQFSKVLSGNGFSDSDLSLLSWLQSIPADTFACPFEQRTLNVDVERLERPQLDAFWTEYMLVTPIKPKTFPHSVMPQARPKSADVMSRSLNPQLEGLPLGLAAAGGGDLYQEFQRGRQRLQEQLAEHEQRRNQYVQQLSGDNRFSEDGYRQTAAYSPAHTVYGHMNGAPRPSGPPPAPPHPHHHPPHPPPHPSVPPHPAGGSVPPSISGTPHRQAVAVAQNGVYQAVNVSR